MRLALIMLSAYFAGSINFAIIILGLLNKEDPRTKFSGNAGTTNVYRQAGKGWAAVALWGLPSLFVPWVGTALVAGNCFPCFHRFQGGKGVASFLGFTIPIVPWGAVLSCLAWVAVYGIVRIPFIASFFMVLTLGGATVLAYDSRAASITGTAVTVLLILFNHRKNVVTLLAERRRRT
jgi:glycerol-3-phosphate acyltransferase PlsY